MLYFNRSEIDEKVSDFDGILCVLKDLVKIVVCNKKN